MRMIRWFILAAFWLALLPAIAEYLPNYTGAPCDVTADAWQPLPDCALTTHKGQQFVRSAYVNQFFKGDARARLTAVILPEKDWAYIDRSGRVVVRHLAMMDNAPNDFHHGLVRVTDRGKWGLVDEQGHIAIPLRYDGMLDFAPGTGWEACTGCHEVGDEDGHHWFEGGEWVRLIRGRRGVVEVTAVRSPTR